jgi:DNA-nicking Smr family endonuclease
MRRHPALEGARLWALVAATVRPLPGRGAPVVAPSSAPPARRGPTEAVAPRPAPPRVAHAGLRPAPAIEPGRHRRLARETEAISGRIDLHGLTQDGARAALAAYLQRAHAEGRRSILVITGKGALGDGVLRRRVPDWLAEPPLRQIVAGLSEAHRRHGGEGAIYVALKRRAKP